jgi:uncharacterized membrane protein YqaE (UPF0057 family)
MAIPKKDHSGLVGLRLCAGKVRWKEWAMRYVLSLVLPPVAVFSTGRWVQGLINIVLTILGWVPGVIHAALIVNDFQQDRRANRIIDAIRASGVLTGVAGQAGLAR